MVKNPRRVRFKPSEDHDKIDSYEFDIVNQSDGTVVQTLDIPKATLTPVADEFEAAINVMPHVDKFELYSFIGRTKAGSVESDNSEPSEAWERAPGPPGKPTAS